MSDTPTSKDDGSADPSEPIDVEFEPADGPAAPSPTTTDKSVGMPSLIVASVAAAIAGGAIGVVASGNSGLDTAKFAPAEVKDEIAGLADIQRDLNERLQSLRGDLSELTARSLGESERVGAALEARSEGEDVLRAELESLTAQLAVIIGDPTQTGGAANNPSTSDDAAPAGPLAGLVTRIDALERRLAAEADAPDTPQKLQRALRDVETRVDEVEAADEALQTALSNRAEALAALQAGLFSANEAIDALEQRLGTLETAPAPRDQNDPDASTALNQRLADLAAQIDALEKARAETPAAPTEPTAALDSANQAALAFSALEAAARRGKPFASAFDRLETALPRDEDVAAIKPISKRGAPTQDQLSDSFDELRASLERSSTQEAEDDGWSWLRNAMSGVVTVRSTGDGSDPAASSLSSIRDALDDDDIAGAVDGARALEGAAAAELKDWLAAAERRVELDTRIDRLRRKLLDAQPVEEG